MALTILKNKLGEILNPIIPRYERLTKYSTDEIKTGKKWIDGKNIYRKVFSYNNVDLNNSTTLNAIIDNNISNITVTDFKSYYRDDDIPSFRPFPSIGTNNTSILDAHWENNKILFRGQDTWSPNVNRYFIAIIEYTKK